MMKKVTSAASDRANQYLWHKMSDTFQKDRGLAFGQENVSPRWRRAMLETALHFVRRPLTSKERAVILKVIEPSAKYYLPALLDPYPRFGVNGVHPLSCELLTVHYRGRRPHRLRRGFRRLIETIQSDIAVAAAKSVDPSMAIDRFWAAARASRSVKALVRPLRALCPSVLGFVTSKQPVIQRVSLFDPDGDTTIAIRASATLATAKLADAVSLIADDPGLMPALRHLARWLMAVQQDDGSWCDEWSERLLQARVEREPQLGGLPAEESILVTAVAVTALRRIAEPGSDTAIERGIQYLLSQQQQDGSWTSPDFLAPYRLMPIPWELSKIWSDPYDIALLADSQNEWFGARTAFVTTVCVDALEAKPVSATRPSLYVGLLPRAILESSILATRPAEWVRQFACRDRESAVSLAGALQLYTLSDCRKLCRALYTKLVDDEDRDIAVFMGLGEHPAQSGHHLMTLFQQANRVAEPKRRLLWPSDLERGGVKDRTSVLVLLDDLVGEGTQAVRYIDALLQRHPLLRRIKIYFLVLVGFKTGLRYIRKKVPSLFRVAAVEELEESTRAFHSRGAIFSSDDRLLYAKAMARRIGVRVLPEGAGYEPRGVHALGWNNSQALIGFYSNTPNNTLPIFWGTGLYRGRRWLPLLRRYQKDVPSDR